MTSKATESKSAPAGKADEPAPVPAAAEKRAGECVVDDGTPHMGRAVNGKVCSAHAINYRPDGKKRP